MRRHDAAVETFRALGDSAFPLAERLRRERALEPEELYYVAFNLAEERGESRAVARELLEHLGRQVRPHQGRQGGEEQAALVARALGVVPPGRLATHSGRPRQGGAAA